MSRIDHVLEVGAQAASVVAAKASVGGARGGACESVDGLARMMGGLDVSVGPIRRLGAAETAKLYQAQGGAAVALLRRATGRQRFLFQAIEKGEMTNAMADGVSVELIELWDESVDLTKQMTDFEIANWKAIRDVGETQRLVMETSLQLSNQRQVLSRLAIASARAEAASALASARINRQARRRELAALMARDDDSSREDRSPVQDEGGEGGEDGEDGEDGEGGVVGEAPWTAESFREAVEAARLAMELEETAGHDADLLEPGGRSTAAAADRRPAGPADGAFVTSRQAAMQQNPLQPMLDSVDTVIKNAERRLDSGEFDAVWRDSGGIQITQNLQLPFGLTAYIVVYTASQKGARRTKILLTKDGRNLTEDVRTHHVGAGYRGSHTRFFSSRLKFAFFLVYLHANVLVASERAEATAW